MRRPKLSLDDQIAHMRDEKGIKFDLVTEADARAFLTNSNYYFKVKAFAKNFEKYATSEHKGKYVDLDFAYLQELSTLDMHLRKFIIKSSLDIEHFLKVRLLHDVMLNTAEDGYDIVTEWLTIYPRVLDDLAFKKSNSMCGELIQKYEYDLAIWNIVEVLSFGDFANLYHYYYRKHPGRRSMNNLVFPVKCIRNAAAHNNCLLNSLKTPYRTTHKSKDATQYVSRIAGMPKPLRVKMMANPVLHDFACLLIVFNEVVSSDMVKMHTMMELHDLLNKRFLRNQAYFRGCMEIQESYRFIKIVVDHFAGIVYH